jgi:arginine deiminase
MHGPLERVYVDSEVEELRSVVLHAPGDAHRHILPEHVEAVLSVKDYLYRRAKVGEEEVASLRLESCADPSQGVTLDGQDLQLRFKTRDGHEGAVPLSRTLEQLFVENPQYILFDDLVDAESIGAEYERFEGVLRAVAPHTLQLSALLHDALHRVQMDAALEEEFFVRLERFSLPEEQANVRASRGYLQERGPRAFLKLLMTGRDFRGRYVFHPLPNLLFTRDLAAAAGGTLILCSAAKPTRMREMALAWLVFTAHPIFVELAREGKLKVVDMLGARAQHATPERITIEGGDILHLGGGTLLVGIGERTTREAAIEMARLLWADSPHTPIERVIAIDILARRASMHLDTIFTMIHQEGDEFEAMVYGPYVQEAGYGDISAIVIEPQHFHHGRRPGPRDFREVRHRSLAQLFAEVQGWRMWALYCGGRPDRAAMRGPAPVEPLRGGLLRLPPRAAQLQARAMDRRRQPLRAGAGHRHHLRPQPPQPRRARRARLQGHHPGRVLAQQPLLPQALPRHRRRARRRPDGRRRALPRPRRPALHDPPPPARAHRPHGLSAASPGPLPRPLPRPGLPPRPPPPQVEGGVALWGGFASPAGLLVSVVEGA